MPFPSQRFEQDKEPALLDVSRIAVSLLKTCQLKSPSEIMVMSCFFTSQL